MSLVIFSIPDGLMASVCGDKIIRIWNVNTGFTVKTLKGHTDHVTCLVFLPENGLLASGSYDTTIKIWNVTTGTNIKTLNEHYYGVTSLVAYQMAYWQVVVWIV